MTISIQLPRPVLDMHFATDRKNTRYAIGGVLIECKNHKAVAAACDGKRLILCEWDTRADDFSVIIPTDDLKRVKLKKTTRWADLSIASDTDATITADQVAYPCKLMDQQHSKFPPYRDVIPQFADDKQREIAPTIAFNPSLLAELLAWMGKHVSPDENMIAWSHGKAAVSRTADRPEKRGDPVLIRATHMADTDLACDMTAVLMPVNL